MARLFRLEQGRYLATTLSGEGGRIVGGRWNTPGNPAVYTSFARSLTVLEKLVHFSGIIPAITFYIVEIEVSNEAIAHFAEDELPSDWQALPTSLSTQKLGDAWLQSMKGVGLAIPSVVVPQDRNVILNPLHRDFREAVRTVSETPFSFDPRLRPGAPEV